MVGKIWLVLWMLCGVWVTDSSILVKTPTETILGTEGKSIVLPCNYSTTASSLRGLIQWNKLLKSHTESVFTQFLGTNETTFGERYINRVKLSGDPLQSDASIIIDRLTMEDNGTYDCSVTLLSDKGGTSQSRLNLMVLYSRTSEDITIYLIVGGIVVGAIVLSLIIYFCRCRNKSGNENEGKGGAKGKLKVHWGSSDQMSDTSGGQYEEDNCETEAGQLFCAPNPDWGSPDQSTSYDCDE
ncbi:cell surface A33 antigen [Talpa occidentalis]|uniref:cell surface A33 antigen n=1 Tax=Talpa occidentalis TaxID=50954 RepID=UPI00188FDACA|nr:cell surface A33 antigen [Talpa occidentalis]